jgi:Concanavalin A-like lectin/glucanases superfamily
MLPLWPVQKGGGHLVSMACYARLALITVAVGCSPRVIDAVVADETSDGGVVEGGAVEGGGVEAASPPDVSDAATKRLLVHRYSFAGPAGTMTVRDTGVEPAGNAIIYNVPQGLSGAGYLELPGGLQPDPTPAYVDLPNFLISRLDTATIEVWVDWRGPMDAGQADAWQRIFDFGDDFSGADLDATPRYPSDPNDPLRGLRDGRSYLYLTPFSAPMVGGVLRLGYLKPEDAMLPRPPGVTGRERFINNDAMPFGRGLHQIAVTVDATQRMSLYLDGSLIGTQDLLGRLADIYDVNCWLGRSQFPADPLLEGNLYDFRVYSAALTQDDIKRNQLNGATNPAVP